MNEPVKEKTNNRKHKSIELLEAVLLSLLIFGLDMLLTKEFGDLKGSMILALVLSGIVFLNKWRRKHE